MAQQAPELLANNVNHWLQKKNVRRMVRTMDGKARAFLSDRYRVIDHEDVMEAVFDALRDAEVRLQSHEVTDRRLYIKATFPNIQTEIRKGDVVESGFVVSNSEIGMGGINVQPLGNASSAWPAATSSYVMKRSGSIPAPQIANGTKP